MTEHFKYKGVSCVCGCACIKTFKRRDGWATVNCFGLLEYQACSQEGSVGSEEPPSQRKVHFTKHKVHLFKKVLCYNYTIQEHRNWPSRLSSCQIKISPTIKSSFD